MKPETAKLMSIFLFFQVNPMVAGDMGSVGKSRFDVLHHQHLAGKSDTCAGIIWW